MLTIHEIKDAVEKNCAGISHKTSSAILDLTLMDLRIREVILML